ncbi:hypothetical protein VPFG_00321 [Vibrio phage nt-1]|uniref:Uncharacterized protein n=1 Tax=Vibrio phage nt-1 TaxID=115992 RepID=R9TFQ8_9CAUD|nr:hypothetical protein VPFG_00321 [Vibrio phage nt-1]AGN30319.1 hypothetical protein VPFG_00321 [Vibrio phage nt-1]
MKADFKIIEIDKWEHSVVIDWGDNCVYKHTLPPEIIEHDLPAESIICILEDLRPRPPEIKSLATLKAMMTYEIDAERDEEFQSLLDELD